MRKTTIFSFILLLSVLLAANACAFTISSDVDEKSVCIGSTSVLSTLVEGSGTYSITSEGTASAFSTTVPNQFSTEDSQTVYSYITPSSKTAPGDYDLSVNINDGTDVKTKQYGIKVKDCPRSEFQVESKKIICPCQAATFLLNVKNNADTAETFAISADSTLNEWMNLSDTTVTLDPGEERTITATIDSPCNIHGQYGITFKAKPSHYFSYLAAKSTLDIQPCYEYSLGFKNNEYSMCENEALSIPLNVLNEGTADNIFKVNIAGPKWMEYDNKIELKAGNESEITVKLNPPYGTQGNFTIKVDALSEYGNVNKKAETSVGVETCYGLSSFFESKKEVICDPSQDYAYPIAIKNSGRFDESFNLSIEGPEWAVLDDANVFLNQNESKNINLNVHLPSNVETKDYNIKIKATDGLAASEDTMVLKAASVAECYAPKIGLENDSLSLALESSEIIAVNLTNNGLAESTFIADLEGDASSFSMINPSLVKLKPGKSTMLYIYVSPQIFAETKDYSLNLSVRIKDTKVTETKNMAITVTESEQANPAVEEGVKEGFFSRMYSKIASFFSFSWLKHAGNESQEAAGNVTEVVKEANVTGVQNATEAVAAEAVQANATSEVNESEKPKKSAFDFLSIFRSKKVQENSSESNATGAEVKVVVENTTAVENMTENNSEKDFEAVSEVNSTLNWDNAKKSLLDFQSYKNYLIAAVSLILIIIIFASGFWRKIIDFFDEEEVVEGKARDKAKDKK